MRILQVMAGAPQGGAETAFVDMCLALHEAGETVEIVTRPNAARVERLQQAGLEVHLLSFGGALDVLTPLKLRRIIRQFKPDIVQTWMSRAAQKTPRWQTSMKIPRYLVVSRLGGYYKRRHFGQSDYFTTITPDIRRFLIDEGVSADRIRHINNFAETESGAAPVDRTTLDIPPDAFVVLALSRLHESKAIDVLLNALAQAPGVHAWIAGDGPLRAELEGQMHALGLQDRVRFLGWRDDRAALLAACDACVFPSRYEPFGTVFVQAWAAGRPVIVSDADGPRQYVRDGIDALMVPRNDVGALAAALRRLTVDADLRQALTAAGQARYHAEFTKEMTVTAYLDFYKTICAQEGLTSS